MKNNQRSHISEMVTLEKVNYVKENKWKNILQAIFIEQSLQLYPVIYMSEISPL